MLNILGIGRSGLHANQYKLDAVADEIANVNTDGYKAKKISFQELIVDQDISVGTKAAITKTDFSQGILKDTGKRWDLAIEGSGFFGIEDDNGNMALTRNGAFTMTEAGILVDERGYGVVAEYLDGYQELDHGKVSLTADGELIVFEDGASRTVGRIPVFDVENPNALTHIGGSWFHPQADAVVISSADEGTGLGKIRSGFLEGSNSDLTKAMTEMIVAQRSYSLNAEALRSTDDLMRLVNDLKR